MAVHPQNAARLLQALAKFGFGGAGVSLQDFLTPDRIVRMGLPPVRIEVMTGISGVTFTECHARRIEAVIDGTPVAVISRKDLLVNKHAAGRSKDRNDIEHLERAEPPPTP